MSLEWIHESPPHWDRQKERIVGGVPEGSVQIGPYAEGELISGEWWRVERDGEVAGYGWMDAVWGDGEILLAVDPSLQRTGVGDFILARLEAEAAARGLNYLYNVVPGNHPDRAGIKRWLEGHGFQSQPDGRLMKRVTNPAAAAD